MTISVDATEKHGVHVEKVDRENAAGLRGQELVPGRARAAGCGADPGGVQDLPHRGGRDQVAELDELALHAPVPQAGLRARVAGARPLIAVKYRRSAAKSTWPTSPEWCWANSARPPAVAAHGVLRAARYAHVV